MPTSFLELKKAKIDDADTEFAYIDSGPPPGDTYITLVIVHGFMYTSQNFARLITLSEKHNTRVIALNRRDYIGTTLFSDRELAQISENSTQEQHETFLRERGEEIAKFLVWIIKELKIPRASDSGDGGLSLLGWSLGNIFTLAFMGHLHLYPTSCIETLEPYFRTFFIYECGSGSYGYSTPYYHPVRDPSIPPRLRGVTFGAWVSTYYEHPFYKRKSTLELQKSISTLVQKPLFPSDKNTFETFTAEELTAFVDSSPSERSDLPLQRAISLETFLKQTKRTFIGLSSGSDGESKDSEAGSISNKLPLPKVEVHVLFGEASIWSIHWGLWELEKDLEKWKSQAESRGGRIRPMHYLPVKDGNHFIHWDLPDLFLRLTRQAARNE